MLANRPQWAAAQQLGRGMFILVDEQTQYIFCFTKQSTKCPILSAMLECANKSAQGDKT